MRVFLIPRLDKNILTHEWQVNIITNNFLRQVQHIQYNAIYKLHLVAFSNDHFVKLLINQKVLSEMKIREVS